MNYGKAIRICRAARGLSQTDLAGQLDLSPSYLSLLEAGKRQPSLRTLERVSRQLHVPTHLLLLLASDPDDLREQSRGDVERLSLALLELLVKSSPDPQAELQFT